MADKLTRLARLRGIEQRVAMLELARRLATEAEAAGEARRAAHAILAEGKSAAPEDYARWLPRALADRQRTRARVGAATEAADAARDLLAEALQSRELADEAVAARRAEQAAHAARRAQAVLDDQAAARAACRNDEASTSANRSRSASSL
jgi:hypothetical protein